LPIDPGTSAEAGEQVTNTTMSPTIDDGRGTGRSGLRGSAKTLLGSTPLELAGAALLCVLGVLYIVLENDSFFNFWTDRDMVRSENLLREFQWMGAELSYGSAARVPGGFLHYFWVLPTLISKDPELSYQFCVLLGMLALIPFYLAMRRSFGAVAAITATMVLLASPILFGTLTRLWNPSFQVPFTILSYAFLVRLLAERHTPSFKWLVASLVVGMQMHLSTYLLVVCVIVALLLTRTRIPWKAGAAALFLTVLLLLPYLIGEVTSGWDNIRQMVGSQGAGAVRKFDVTRGVLYNPDNVGDVWRWYMLATGMNDNLPVVPLQTAFSWLLNLAILLGGGYTVLSLMHWLEWGKPIARALNVSCGGAHGRVLVGALIPVLIGFLYFSYSPQVELVIYGNSRYLMFAIPGLAIIAGLGTGALFEVARHSMPARAVLLVPVAAAVITPAWALHGSLLSLNKVWDKPGREFLGSLDQVRREMNWSLTEAVTRTTVLRRYKSESDRWLFESIFGIGYELHRNNIPVPFSDKGECAAYVNNGAKVYGDKGMSLEALERTFEQPSLKLSIVRQKRMSNDHLVVYRRLDGQGYCFSSVHNRYVFSDEEKIMFERYGKIPLATAESTSATLKPGAKGYTLNLGQGIYMMLKLSHNAGKMTLEVHSNQLRGDTYNGGFLDIGMISNARLMFVSASGDRVEIPIEKGLLGGKGTFTPLLQTYDVPSGKYTITFEAEVFPPVKLGVWPVSFDDKKPVSIPVASGYDVGN
jgi:Dolichyl-phosphate-mannose-protein mannosyltransferase